MALPQTGSGTPCCTCPDRTSVPTVALFDAHPRAVAGIQGMWRRRKIDHPYFVSAEPRSIVTVQQAARQRVAFTKSARKSRIRLRGGPRGGSESRVHRSRRTPSRLVGIGRSGIELRSTHRNELPAMGIADPA
jgi:hypothetical protein